MEVSDEETHNHNSGLMCHIVTPPPHNNRLDFSVMQRTTTKKQQKTKKRATPDSHTTRGSALRDAKTPAGDLQAINN